MMKQITHKPDRSQRPTCKPRRRIYSVQRLCANISHPLMPAYVVPRIQGRNRASRGRLSNNRSAAAAAPLAASSSAYEEPHREGATSSTLALNPSDTWLGSQFLRLLPAWKKYCVSFLMPLATVFAGVGATWGPTVFSKLFARPLPNIATLALSLLVVFYAFIAIPICDSIMGREVENPSGLETADAADSAQYHRILHAYVVVHLAVLGLVCHLVSTHASVSLMALMGVATSAGVANGIGFTVAHELLHSPRRLDRLLSAALLVPTAYLFWTQSHLQHHVKVGTPEDPSTARFGESLWAFIPRSVIGNIIDGFKEEAKRRQRKHIKFWSVQNLALWWIACPAALAGMTYAIWGPRGLAFYAVQCIVGIAMLETVNYIEHYGLVRKKLPDGRYERVTPQHSWNATTVFTNNVAFRLQRHADHHASERKPYHLLRNLPQAPQLPGGYPAMMLLATVPPAWFAVMDPLATQTREKLQVQHQE
jgi:alkane 1-monooxygenase